MTTTTDVHVIFGTGPVGLAIMDELVQQGKQVRMVNRSGNAELSGGVELLSGDASDVDFATKACSGAAVVYQALNPPYSKWPELFPALQMAVLEGAKSTEAVYVSMENLYMYGASGGQALTEETAYQAHTRKGKVRADMAKELIRSHQSGEVRVVMARAADFFGPRVLISAMAERVFPAALEGRTVQVLGNPDKLHSYTYMPDIGRALVLLAESDDAWGKVWHIPSAETLTTRAFIERIFNTAGHEAKVGVVPTLLLRMMGLFNANIREVIEMLYQFEEDFVCDGSQLARSFGFIPTPLDDALSNTLAWYKNHA